MGGFAQPQSQVCALYALVQRIWTYRLSFDSQVQILLNMLRGMNPQEALDAPRFCISAGLPDAEVKTAGSAGDINSEVRLAIFGFVDHN